MNKLLLFLALSFSSYLTYAQCVPDTNITHNVPGIYPDTAVGLPHSYVGQPYGATIQLNVKTDTVVLGFNATIDSIVIDNVTGLPQGFAYSCTPSSCSFPGGSNGCIYLYGPAPTTFMAGTYNIVVDVTAYGQLGGTPTHISDNIAGYKIVIDTTTGISGVDKVTFFAGQNSPNPASRITMIPVTLSHPDNISVSISNLLGKEVSSRIYNLQKGKNNIPLDLHGLQPGIYLYSVTNGKNTVTRRMIISND